MEARLAEEKGQNGRNVFPGTVSTEFYLVTDFLWTASTIVGIDRNCGDVGIDRDDHEEILPLIKVGILSAGPISAVGKLCHDTQCGDCGVELALSRLFCAPHRGRCSN